MTIRIRKALPTDCRNVYDWLYYSDLSIFLNKLEGYTESTIPSFEDFRKDYNEYFFDDLKENYGRSYIIITDKDKEETGHISYTSFHLLKGIAEFDIWLKEKKYTGFGIGSKAITILSEQLFNNGYTRIIMRPSIKNIPAIKSYMKAGFVEKKLNAGNYYKPEYIKLYGTGDYGKGNDLFLILKKK